jgi:hypothetical protein
MPAAELGPLGHLVSSLRPGGDRPAAIAVTARGSGAHPFGQVHLQPTRTGTGGSVERMISVEVPLASRREMARRVGVADLALGLDPRRGGVDRVRNRHGARASPTSSPPPLGDARRAPAGPGPPSAWPGRAGRRMRRVGARCRSAASSARREASGCRPRGGGAPSGWPSPASARVAVALEGVGIGLVVVTEVVTELALLVKRSSQRGHWCTSIAMATTPRSGRCAPSPSV